MEVDASHLATLVATDGYRHRCVLIVGRATRCLRESTPLLLCGVVCGDAPRLCGVDVYPLCLLHPGELVGICKLCRYPSALIGRAGYRCTKQPKQEQLFDFHLLGIARRLGMWSPSATKVYFFGQTIYITKKHRQFLAVLFINYQ